MVLGINERAWSGVNIMIFGQTPLLPMQIEQSIAAASPANEIKIDSFEDYKQAYDFCKNQKTVGLILIEENKDSVLSADTFKELAQHYESKGWPCFGVLVYTNEKSMMGYLSMQKNRNLIAYISAKDFTEPSRVYNTLGEIWSQFVNAFESNVIPQKLQETLLSIVEPVVSHESFNFRSRLSTVLSQGMNVSWIEMVALRWRPVVEAVEKINSNAMKPNQALSQIVAQALPDNVSSDMVATVKANTSLCKRISKLVEILDGARLNGSLANELANIGAIAKPGSPALLRQLSKSKDRIISIAAEYKTNPVRLIG